MLRGTLAGFAVALASTFCLAAASTSKKAGPDIDAARDCSKDVIEQSVCIYKAILDDVSRNYRMRGGGGISRVVQNSTTSYSVHIQQEGHQDVRTYEVKLGAKGKVTIVGVTEEAVTR